MGWGCTKINGVDQIGFKNRFLVTLRLRSLAFSTERKKSDFLKKSEIFKKSDFLKMANSTMTGVYTVGDERNWSDYNMSAE